MPKASTFARSELAAPLVKHQAVLRNYLEAWLFEQECLLRDALVDGAEPDSGAHPDESTAICAGQNSASMPPDRFEPAPVAPAALHAQPTHTPKTSIGTVRTRAKSLATIGTRAKSFMSKGTIERGMQVLGFRATKYAHQHTGRLQEAESFADNWGEEWPAVLFLNRVFHSAAFESTCQVVILANTITLALSTEYYVDHPESDKHDVYDSFEVAFLVFYTLEILLRIVVLRVQFFIGSENGWNIFELLLVVSSMQTQVGTGSSNLSYTRAMRMFKVLKVLRVVRLMRDFRELRLILDSLMGSVKSLVWSIVLILAINFMFGMCFVRAVTYAFADPDVSEAAKDNMHEYWGSLSKSILSLYWATTGGNDWGDISDCLWHAGSIYYIIFCFYIGVFLFVIMNSLTSLFVDSVMQYAESDEHEMIQDKLMRKAEYMSKLVSLFRELDKSGQGEITLEDFREHLEDPRIEAFGASMDVETSDLERCFRVLTAEGHRTVDMESFVVGCIRMKGNARSIDMQGCLLSQRKASEDHRKLASMVARQQQSLRDIEHQLHSAFAKQPALARGPPPEALAAEIQDHSCRRSVRFSVGDAAPMAAPSLKAPRDGSPSLPLPPIERVVPPLASAKTLGLAAGGDPSLDFAVPAVPTEHSHFRNLQQQEPSRCSCSKGRK